MAEGTQRRLTVIVSADVVGYSRLMARDEAGTLRRLNELCADHIDPLIAKYGRRIVKTTGDGLLLEFPSVVAAVECVVTVQEGMAARNADIKDDEAIRFRIGLHLGDVIVEGLDSQTKCNSFMTGNCNGNRIQSARYRREIQAFPAS